MAVVVGPVRFVLLLVFRKVREAATTVHLAKRNARRKGRGARVFLQS